MKKIFSVFLLITISGFTQAQQNIVGSWEVNLNESLYRMRDDMKILYDTLPVQAKQRISQAFDNRKFIFQSEGIVTIQWEKENALQQVQGTWSYEAASNKLTITTHTSEVSEFEVTMLTSSVLVLKMNDMGGIFRELYLMKRS